MNTDAARALASLQNPSSGRTTALAALVVDNTLSAPLSKVARPDWIATQLSAGLEAATQGPALREFVARHLSELKRRVAQSKQPPRDLLPSEVEAPLRELLGHPWSPNERITYRIIDQGVFHELLKEVLDTSIRRFTAKARRFDKQRLGGFGKQAKKLGRGLFGGLGQNLSGAAESLIAGVSEEFEAVFEGRIDAFLEGASTEALKVVAAHLCDPDHAEAYADLRNAILDVLLDTPISELIEEFDKLGPLEAVDTVIAATRLLVQRPDFIESCARRIEQLQTEAGDGTLEHWLTELKLQDVWRRSSIELLNQRLDVIVQEPAFEAWWADLFTPAVAD